MTPARPILIATLLLVSAPAVPAQDAPAQAKDAIQALGAAEAQAARGRLTLSVSDRRGERKGLETDSESRKRIAALPAGVAEGTLLYGPEGWLKDLNVPASAQSPKPLRVRTAEAAGVLRNLMEVTAQDKAEAFGRVLKVPTTSPADAILTRRAARGLETVTWSSVKNEPEKIVLEGKRGQETHTVTLGRQPAVYLQDWTMRRQVMTPEGRNLEQVYECRVTLASGGVSKVEEWMTVGSPVNSLTLRTTEVKKSETLSELKPEELQLRFPKGTLVVDSRGEVPLEYEQTAEGVNDEELSAAARALAQGRARAGETAPAFELKDGKGKVVRLEEMRGEVVLLFWFNSVSKPADAAAPAIEALYDRYKKKGLRVLGLNVAEVGDPIQQAEAYRKRFKWSFPVFVDPQGEAMHRYGLIAGVPKIAVIDREGKLAYVQPGADIETVSDLIEKLTAGKQ